MAAIPVAARRSTAVRSTRIFSKIRIFPSTSNPNRNPKVLFTIYPQSGVITINAFDMDGLLVRLFSMEIPCSGPLPTLMGFTVVGSRLYMFGGIPFEDVEDFDPRHTYMLDIIKIPRALDRGQKFMDLLESGPDMNGGKLAPFVYVVGDLIFVLSAELYSCGSNVEFEVLDTVNNTFTKLPNPPIPKSTNHDLVEVKSHALVGEKFIVVSVEPCKRICVFDIAKGRWDSYTTLAICSFQPIVTMKVVHGRISSSSTPQPVYSYYVLSPSGSSLLLFKDFFADKHDQELQITPALPCVCHGTQYHVAVVNDVIFIIRLGSPFPYLNSFSPAKTYMTIDTYKVTTRQGNQITKLGASQYLVKDDYPMQPLLYTIPASLADLR